VSVYINTGKLGSGKTLLAVSRIRKYLKEGRRVATNLNLNLEHLLPATDKTARVLRIPDKPKVEDLDAVGLGSDVPFDESKFGLIVMDELGSWLNSREWADKGRQAVIDWFIHARKLRWDVILIVQNVSMIDKQIRDALAEYVVTCKRLDRVRVPVFGAIGRIVSFGAWDGRVGKVHLGVVVYTAGSSPNSPLVTDRWMYRGRDLYAAYDTEQRFTSAEMGAYSYLTPWHLKGRYLPPQLSSWQRLLDAVAPVGRRQQATWAVERKLPAVRRLMALPPDLRLRAAAAMMRRADGIHCSPC